MKTKKINLMKKKLLKSKKLLLSYDLLGITFGFATYELVGDSSLKWVVHTLLYIIMVSSFKMGHKIVEKTYETKLSITEQVIFYLTMFIAYMMTI